MVAYGLHLGACSACLAVHGDGKTEVLANDLGDRVTPAVVAFTDHDISVGAGARQGAVRNAANTVSHVKHIIGSQLDDPKVKEYTQSHQVSVNKHNGSLVFNVEYMGKKAHYTPSKIMELIYQKLLETAHSHSGGGSKDAVLAVPSDFTQHQRNLLSDAATNAGFKVLRVISEPSSAMLAFDVGQFDGTEQTKALVYRLGGTSHDATLVNVEHGMYCIMAKSTQTQFGADQLTVVLRDFLAAEFNRQYRCDVKESKRSMSKLQLAAERCKHSLSSMANAQCSVESLYEGLDFSYNMSRGRFEMLCTPLLAQCTQLVQEVLDKAGWNKEDISKVIVCGGGAKSPVVKRVMSDFLPSSTLLNSIPEDEIIAVGAAKEAALLEGDVGDKASVGEENSVIFKSLSKAICVRVNSPELQVVLPQHCLVPARRQHTLTLAQTQTSVVMEILESNEPVPSDKDARLLAKIVLRDLPPGSSIKSNFHLTRDGEIHVTSHEVTSDKSQTVKISCH